MSTTSTRQVVLCHPVRTAIGTYGGSLKDTPPTALAALVTREALARAGVDGKDVGHVVFGHVINTEPRDMYMGRVAAIEGGCSVETPGLTLNRLCGSGLQAVISAAQSILLGDVEVAVAGGAESMSRAPYASLATRWGARMGNATLTDMMLGALHDPFDNIHMGVTAENVAAKFDISRAQQDEAALETHRRAQQSVDGGQSSRTGVVGCESVHTGGSACSRAGLTLCDSALPGIAAGGPTHRSIRHGAARLRSDRRLNERAGEAHRRLVVPEVGDEVAAQRSAARVVPPVHVLEGVICEVVELPLGSVVAVARLVGRADPPVPGDRAEVHVDA